MAFMAAMKGYRMVLTMPSFTSLERRVTMRAFGADLVLTDPTKGMGGTVKKAYQLLESTPDSFMLQQFSNPANTQVFTRFNESSITDSDHQLALRMPFIRRIFLNLRSPRILELSEWDQC